MEDRETVSIEYYCSTTPGIGFMKSMTKIRRNVLCSYRLPWCDGLQFLLVLVALKLMTDKYELVVMVPAVLL